MIEIVRQGALPEEKKYTATCYNCKTVFTFLRGDASYVSDQRDGDCLVVDCPVCKKPLYITL